MRPHTPRIIHRSLPTFLRSSSSLQHTPSLAQSVPALQRDASSLSRSSGSSFSNSTVSLSSQPSTFSAFQPPSSSASTVSSSPSVHSFISNSTTPAQSQLSSTFSAQSDTSSRTSLGSSLLDSQASIAIANIPAAMSDGVILGHATAPHHPSQDSFHFNNESTDSLSHLSTSQLSSSVGSLPLYTVHEGILRRPSNLEPLEESTASLASTYSTNPRHNPFLRRTPMRPDFTQHSGSSESLLFFPTLRQSP